MNLIKYINHNLINIPGWHTKRKIIVIESDDWGSIRMPSLEIFNKFIEKGIRVNNDAYCKYDNLATIEDFEKLFKVLTSVKDKNGRNAVLTANTIVANPDFDKIRESKFKEYHYEPFTVTLKNLTTHNDVFQMWMDGINHGIFHPQFHGREHLNVKGWMKSLVDGDELTHLAFNLKTFGLTSKVDNRINSNYMGAFNSGLDDDIKSYELIIKEGLDLFENIFGYKSLSFIPTTYTWSPKIENILKANGVKYLQGLVSQRIPIDDNTIFKFKKNNYTGNYSTNGLIYLTRNCFFEPSHFRDKFDVVKEALKRIDYAFLWGKPAIISMHRLNVIGSLNQENREINLKLLLKLLIEVTKKYPNIEFMTSDELGKLCESEN